MIYGDNPNKINEREDALGLKQYTYAPNIIAIIQAGNLYVYCGNNPIFYFDDKGKDAVLASELLKWSWMVGGTISQADSPLPGPADIIGLCVAIGGSIIAGGFYLYNVLENKPVNLPSYKKVKIDMDHIMSGHSEGGNRGGPNKDRFPIEMTAPNDRACHKRSL